MKIYDKIKDRKLHYNITREAVKISALSSSKYRSNLISNINILHVKKYCFFIKVE